jgi:hypothetical protein
MDSAAAGTQGVACRGALSRVSGQSFPGEAHRLLC